MEQPIEVLSEVTQELERIREEHNGVLRPIDVVTEAADPASVLHSRFNWDDTAAGHQWRLMQARTLIRASVRLLPYNGTSRPMRIFVSLLPDRYVPGGGYRATIEVMSSEAQRMQLLSQALEEMRRFQSKFRDLSELVNVFDAMADAWQKYQSSAPPPSSGGVEDQPQA